MAHPRVATNARQTKDFDARRTRLRQTRARPQVGLRDERTQRLLDRSTPLTTLIRASLYSSLLYIKNIHVVNQSLVYYLLLLLFWMIYIAIIYYYYYYINILLGYSLLYLYFSLNLNISKIYF